MLRLKSAGLKLSATLTSSASVYFGQATVYSGTQLQDDKAGLMAQKRQKKLSLEETAEKLTAIAEEHLSELPEEEQDARVAAFARVKFEPSLERRAKSSSSSRIRRSRAAARVR